MMSPRSGAGVARQISNPRRADATARATSSEFESGNCPITSEVSAGLTLSNVSPDDAAVHAPAMKFLKTGISELRSCQVAKLPSCQVAKLPSCQVAKLPSCQVAKLPSYRKVTRSAFNSATLQLCNSATLQLCNSSTHQLIHTST